MNSEMFADYKDTVTREQLQEMLGIGKSLAYKLLQSQQIKSIRVGRQYRVCKVDIIKYLQDN